MQLHEEISEIALWQQKDRENSSYCMVLFIWNFKTNKINLYYEKSLKKLASLGDCLDSPMILLL